MKFKTCKESGARSVELTCPEEGVTLNVSVWPDGSLFFLLREPGEKGRYELGQHVVPPDLVPKLLSKLVQETLKMREAQ
jgi:hypothetical protein